VLPWPAVNEAMVEAETKVYSHEAKTSREAELGQVLAVLRRW